MLQVQVQEVKDTMKVNFEYRAKDFANGTSAMNWMALQRAALAHQQARYIDSASNQEQLLGLLRRLDTSKTQPEWIARWEEEIVLAMTDVPMSRWVHKWLTL